MHIDFYITKINIHLSDSNMKLEEWNKDMPKLSKEELLKLFEDEYIDSGYLYSGCIPANATIFRKYKEHYELARSLVEER